MKASEEKFQVSWLLPATEGTDYVHRYGHRYGRKTFSSVEEALGFSAGAVRYGLVMEISMTSLAHLLITEPKAEESAAEVEEPKAEESAAEVEEPPIRFFSNGCSSPIVVSIDDDDDDDYW
jgi:hypothetical protein